MVSIAQKMTRAFLVGLTIGIIAGLGFYFMTTAINMIAGSTVFDPIAMLIITMGFVLVAAIAIELSADISSKTDPTTTNHTSLMEIGPNAAQAMDVLALALQKSEAQGEKNQPDGPPKPNT